MNDKLFRLDGRVAVVTGGARGLGKAAAVGFASFGADVALIDISADACADTSREIKALGRRTHVYACDVSDFSAVKKTVSAVAADFSRVDILANIAGITARIPTTEMPEKTVRNLTEVNYYGTFWMCKEVGAIMLTQKRGSIINMSALGGGLVGLGRGNAAYCATKGAVSALTRDLACEWGGRGIRVNAVAPCWFHTDMNSTSIFSRKDFLDQVMAKLPMKHIGLPEEIVGPIVFLASDASSMITGITLPVDGGAAETSPIEWNG